MPLQPIEDAIKAIRNGSFAVVVDDEDRENEGDLILAAEKATPEALAFMVRHTSGVICQSIEAKRLEELDIPMMVTTNTDPKKTAFTVSVDALSGTSTGISAADRSATIHALIDPATRPKDLSRPGHVFPLKCREGGVLKRAGHTEAAVDLCQLAGLYPSGILSEIVNDDGTMMRRPELSKFAVKHNLPLVSIADLIRYRRRHEKLVEKVSEGRIPTQAGVFTAQVYRSVLDGIEHVAFVAGDLSAADAPLVRVHSECLTGDIFGSLRCDCGSQLQAAQEMIANEGAGAIIYLRGHEGRGIGLSHKMRAYSLQDEGQDTVEANISLGFPPDKREYGIGAQIIADLGITRMRLMTNNPLKYGGLEGYDLEIVERVPLISKPTVENVRYLKAKQERMGHLLNLTDKEMTHA